MRNSMLLTFSIIFLLSACSISSSEVQGLQPGWHTFTTEDGLPDDDVQALAVDPNGYLWAGFFWGGVARYDGSEWWTPPGWENLPEGSINAIALDADGGVWAGSQNGRIYHWDGEAWSTLLPPSKEGNAIYALLFDDQGRLWAGTWVGLLRYDDGEWERMVPPGEEQLPGVKSLAFDQDGVLWIGTRYGLYRYVDGTWMLVGSERIYDITSIVFDDEQILWSATMDGLMVFNGDDFSFTSLEDLPLDSSSVVTIDSDGAVLMGGSGGAARFDGHDWASIGPDDGFAGGYIQTMDVTPDGAIWFGTGQGLTYYLPEAVDE